MSLRLPFLGLVAALTGPALFAADLVPLPLVLPPPLFVGTPKPLNVPNLEPPRVGARPPLMVPAGTVLLSRDKPVTASDSAPVIGEASYVTDGDKTSAEGSIMEMGPGVQWVQIDLGAPVKLQAVVVWHSHAKPAVYHGVVVQASDDATFQTSVRTLFNNDRANADGRGAGTDLEYIETNEGRLIPAKGAVARYVRLYSNGSTTDELNDCVEVEVYGQAPAK